MRAKNPSSAFLRGVIILCLLTVNGISAEACRKGCPTSDNGLLQYTAGNVYEYNFDSVLTVGLNANIGGSGAAETDDTNLKVTGIAKLYSEGNCGYTLQLGAIKVQATKESVEKKITQSIQKPVHFTIVSGKVQPEICTDASDTAYSLNVKRAIISLFHASTEGSESVAEVDVFGQCPTHTSVSKIAGKEIVTKVRNLNSCAYRENIREGIVSGVVNDKAGIRNSMLLQADYVKESKLERGVLENVQLVEEYKFTGAPKGGAGVRAKVLTSLKLKNIAGSPAAAPASGQNPESIIFQKPETYAAKNIAALKNALGQTVQSVDNYVQKNAGKHFVELIRLMRNADTESLLDLAAFPHPNKVLARRVYLDALFRTGTAEAAKAILKQVNKMDEKEKKIALLSLNLVQVVDKETLNAAAGLLGANSLNEVYLAVGTIVSKFCQRNGCDHGEVDLISKKFTDALRRCKANTKKDEERIVNVLKGIRNTQHIASNTASVLAECAAVGPSTRIRVAALQAFSAAACEPVLQKKVIELLHDRNEDSELRIEAFLSAITCPNAELANQIADIVNSETVYQVGGFIASSLKAIRDSTDATRENQRYHLANIRVTKQFPRDYRRYSFNNEVSYKLDALGLSASADYKLIYSQQGFLPRSGRLNVTTEIFGVNYNIFEASVRQENVENVLEYYLGPKGLLNKDFDEIMQIIQSGGSGGDRVRRSIADETGKFAKKYKTYGTKNVHDLNLDLSLKLFGSEMFFLSLGDNIPGSLEDVIRHFSTLVDDVKKGLSSYNKEFNAHTLFEDSEIIYPTGAGFPLEFSTQGFAANKLDFGIEFDVDGLLQQTWQQSKYRLKVVPSFDVNVNVQLGFNAYVVSTGTRVVFSGHSATGSDARFEFTDGGNGFNLDVELPREKLELVDLELSADFYIAEQDKDVKSIPLKGAKKRKHEPTEDCFNQFEIVGLNICFATSILDPAKSTALQPHNAGKAQGHSEGLHLARPFSFTLYLTSERRFNIKGKYEPQTPNGSQQWKLNYSTPGSKVSHNTALTFELGTKPRVYGRASFHHPQYHFALEAGVNNDNRELVLYGQYEHNNDVKKNKIGFVKHGNEYHPIIEIQDKNGVTNDLNGYRADGKVVVQQLGEKQTRYNFENFQVVNAENERVVVNGWADVGPVYFNSELRVAPGQESYFIKSNFKVDNGEYSIGYFVNDEKTPDTVIGGSARVKVDEKEIEVSVIGKVGTWELKSETEIEYEKAEGATVINPTQFKGELVLKQKQNVVGSVQLTGITEGQNKLQVNASVVRGKKTASVGVKYSRNQRTPGDYNIEVNSKFNKHFVDLLATCDIKGNVFVINNVLTTSWGTSLTAKGELGQRYTPQDVLIDLQGTAQFSDKEKQTQWILKAIGAPEKTTSEFKLSRNNAELIKFDGELQHPQDKITVGKVSLQIKNTASAKLDFKVAKNGKGELTGNVEMLKTEQKHKVELSSKFHIQAPKYDVDTTLTLDANKKVYFKTENNVEKLKFSTKNYAEIADKKIKFDANGQVKGEWRLNGEVLGDFTFTCPEGRVVDGTLKRKMTTNSKTGISQGTADLHLNDKLANSDQKRSLELSGKLEKANLKAREFASEIKAVYANFEGKKLEVKYHLKHLPKGQFKFIDFGVTERGDLINVPIELSLVVDEYSAKHAVYRASGQYGNYGTTNVNGRYNVGERGAAATYEVHGNLQVPQSAFKSFEFKSNGTLTKPDIEDGTGSYVAELHIDERTGNNQFVRFNTLWKTSQTRGTYNLDLETEQMKSPLKLGGHYSREQEGSLREGNANGKQKYGLNFNYGDKFVNTATDISYSGSDTANFHYTLDSSFESAKGIDVLVSGQKLDAESYVVNVKATQAGVTYAVESKFFGSTHKKGLNLHANLPSGAPVVVIGVFELLGERRIKLTLNVENLAELDLKANTEASYKGVDDFYIVAQWNSAKLNLNNYDLDIRSQGKTITFNLKNAQGVISAGSASYTLKTEKNKSTLDGQGQLQYNGKSQNTNFRLIRQHYELATDKEVGFSYTFNGNFGPKNSVSILKITNTDFNVKVSVCEEKKQCSNVQIQSIATVDEHDVSSIQHSLLIDLRELGYPHEFELQSKTTRQGLKFQYSLDSSINSNNNMKYQLVASVLPTSSKVQIKLPSREILLETQQKLPPQGKLFGQYENSVAFYFDKTRKPNDVTRLVANADVGGVERVAFNLNGHLKFEHPTIRPLTVSGKLNTNRQQNLFDAEIIFDIFRLSEQKVEASSRVINSPSNYGFNITTAQVVRSAGLGFQHNFNGHIAMNTETQEFSAGADLQSGASDLKASALIFGNKDRVEVLVYSMNEQIVQLVGKFNRQKYISQFHTKLQAFGQKPVELHTEIQPSLATFSIKRDDLLDATGEVKLGKEAKFNIIGAGKQLYSGSIALDAAKFLQTNYASNEEEVKAFLNSVEVEVQKETEAVREQLKKRFQKTREAVGRQIQLAKDSTPDFAPLKANFEQNVNEIASELERDPTLKQIIDTYRKLYAAIAKIAGDIAKTSAESYEKLHESFVALHTKLETIFRDTILPAWEELSVAFAGLIGELRVAVVNFYTKAFQAVLDILEKYGPTLKNYGKAFNDSLKPFNEAAQELYKVIAHATDELLEELKEWVAKVPTFDALRAEFKDKVDKLKLVEKTLQFVNDFFTQLNVLPLTPETSTFLQKAHEYIEAKLKQQSVDDEKLVEELVNLLVKALRSIWATLQVTTPSSAAGVSVNSITSLFSTLPFSVDVFSKLPALLSFRLSVLNFLLNENWEHIFTRDLFKSWVFFHDFELKGHIADGRYIFTFDGGLVTFPGSCKYILAQDSFDNNFTVIAQLNNGKLKTITLTDRDGGFVEVNDAGVLKINGNAAEFPQHVSGLHAWRQFYTVWLRSEYGAQVMCTSDLKVCHIDVDGFYTSKTRGLLGNGNAEPNDDFVQADGTIAPDSASFGNGYGLGKCNPVAPVNYDQQEHAEICNEVFGLESPLALGYLAIDSRPFRRACDHAAASAGEKDKETAACTIATAYGSALKMENFIVMLPPRCLKCSGAPGQRELGQEFTVKIPNNKADLVFVVDTAITPTVLNNLVTPVLHGVREALKTRGFTDVQIAVVAFNDNQRYPALLTSDNGKLNYQGNLADVKLNGPKRICENCISQVASDKTLTEVYETVERFLKSIFPQPDETAFNLALNYPFRAGAAKSIVGVYSNSMDNNNLFKFIRAHAADAFTKFDGALLHMIAPVQDLSLEGVPTEKLVGFNSRLVATLDGKDNKKRQKLQFKNDLGVDFVLDNGGWVFASQNFDKLKPEEQKKALNQVTSSIADTLFKTEIVSDCRCTPLHGVHAHHWCTIKSSTFVPNKKPKAA